MRAEIAQYPVTKIGIGVGWRGRVGWAGAALLLKCIQIFINVGINTLHFHVNPVIRLNFNIILVQRGIYNTAMVQYNAVKFF